MNYEAVDMPKTLDGLFASIATDAGSLATVVCGFSIQGNAAPVTIIDWSEDDMTPKTLARVVPAAIASLESLRKEIRVINAPPDCVMIDTAGAGGPLCEQAIAGGYEGIEAITENGALKYPLPADRVQAAQFYLTCGSVAIAKSALEYSLLHRGVFGNHLRRALKAWGPNKEAREPGVLLVAVVNGVLEAFVDPKLKGRAMMEHYVQ